MVDTAGVQSGSHPFPEDFDKPKRLVPGNKVMVMRCPGMEVDQDTVGVIREPQTVCEVMRMEPVDAVYLEGRSEVFRACDVEPADESIEEVVRLAEEALQNAEGAYEALEVAGLKEQLPGFEGCVERHRRALVALAKVRRK